MLEYLNDVLLGLEVYEGFLLACLFGLNAWLTTDLIVPFWPAHWCGTLPTQANKMLVQRKHTHKSSLSSVADFQGYDFVLQRAEASCLALLCCPSVGPLLKIIPRLPKKENVYLVHAKLDTTDKCN